MKEQILEAFANLGFKLEDADGAGYVFDYEGTRYLYMYNEDDENFLSIAIPGFHEFDENKAAQYCALAEKVNSTLKYVKAYTLGGSMWLFYERELVGGEDLEVIIPRMIYQLEGGLMFARNAIREIETSFADDTDAVVDISDESTDENNE